jgi:hypothetical protein
MTPKEKAKELVERFREYSHTEFISYRGGYQLDTQIQNAKQCALIAVDEILISLRDKDLYCAGENNINDFIKHWQVVKTEIEAL